MKEVTSLADLQVYAQGQVVELPGFFSEEPFVVRLRRPSLLALTKSGKIPNALLSAANELFTGNQDKSDPVDLSEIMGVLEVICESALLEPTYKDVVDAGLTLTDEQYTAIFNFSQRGIKALEPFRTKSEEHQSPTGTGTEVPQTSV